MIYFLWIRGYIPTIVIEKDPLLLKTINDISNKDYNQARHDVMVERSVPHIVVDQNGDRESWNCSGNVKDSKPFPCLFTSNGGIQSTWGNCDKMGDKCPYHDYYQFKSQSKVRCSRKRKIHFLMHSDKSIQQRVNHEFGVGPVPCQKELFHGDAFVGDTQMIHESHSCPKNGMRRTENGSSYVICPWVVTFTGIFPTYNTLNDIPQSFLFPPETSYSLACVILHSEHQGHYIGISLDAKNPRGIHVSYDGMLAMAKRVQPIRMDDPKYTRGFMIAELWYVKVGSSTGKLGTDVPKIPASPPSASVLYASLKPAGLHNFGNTCYLNTLVQIIFWVVPIRKKLMDYKLSKGDLDKIPAVVSNDFEADNVKLYGGLESLQKVLASLKVAMTRKRAILKTQMQKMLNVLGLSSFENKCVNEMWMNLFHHYFEYIGFQNLYNIQLTTYQRETLEPNKRGRKPHESKNTRPEPLLQIDQSDLKK